MKKHLALFLAIVFCLCLLAACAGNGAAPAEKTESGTEGHQTQKIRQTAAAKAQKT